MTILKELESLIPPLSNAEKELLTQSILSEGIRENLIVARVTDKETGKAEEYLADGHNRYRIAEEYAISYCTETRDFESLSDVKLWMIDNQNGRRNLTDGWKYELSLIKKELLLEKGRETMSNKGKEGGRGNKKGLSIIDKPLKQPTQHNTRNEIASTLGWSTGKVAMADKVWKEAEPDIKEKVKSGEMTVSGAYKEVKKQEKIEERKKEIESKKAAPVKAEKEWFVNGDSREETKNAPNGIKLIFTDPPYGMNYQSNRRVQSPKALKIQDDDTVENAIKLFQDVMSNLVPKMQEDSAALVWCSFRDERFFADALTGLGLEIKNSIIWVRPNHGTGDLKGSFAPKHDRLLFAVKGKPVLAPRLPDVLDGSEFLKTEHPTKKPIDLIGKVIGSLTMPGDIVVDPFAGSCSVGVPAIKRGRQFWGCELEKIYWVEGQEHLNQLQ